MLRELRALIEAMQSQALITWVMREAQGDEPAPSGSVTARQVEAWAEELHQITGALEAASQACICGALLHGAQPAPGPCPSCGLQRGQYRETNQQHVCADRWHERPACAREVMRQADDSTAYLEVRCTCGRCRS